MMSLKPRNVDFQETWANLRQTVAGVVALKGVQRSEWNTRFSDVYALCVAHPEPLAERLLDETRAFLEQHVAGLLKDICGDTPRDCDDHTDGLLTRYVKSWREYSEGAAYLNCLYSYLNLQHVKRQKVSDAEIMYGGCGGGDDTGARQLEVGALALELWERGVLGPLGTAITRRTVRALAAARDCTLDPSLSSVLKDAIHSTVRVRDHRVRAPTALYEKLVLNPHLAASASVHARRAAALLESLPVSEYTAKAGAILSREADIARMYLHPSSVEAVRACAEHACVAAHLPALHAECGNLLRAALDAPPDEKDRRRSELRNLHRLLAPLGAHALKPLVDCAHALAAQEGHAAADTHHKDDAHIQFVSSMLALHSKYSELFTDVFTSHQPFQGALDKACSEVVNARASPDAPARAPELLARYCDTLLRKKSGGECDTEEKLSAAITVFKYVDDKDVFQKYYARALARRLIHQLSASMEQEEAMINRLKAACGYEFTNKLHRMFTDVQVSQDLNTKFQQHLQQTGQQLDTGFYIQVLQAGAWPLGGAMAPLAPPLQLERAARAFDAFYRRAFCGRRLAWLHHLCTGELRAKYPPRPCLLVASTQQCAILLCFESADSVPASEVMSIVQADGEESWRRQLRPLLEAGLLLEAGDNLSLNLAFTSKRSRLRLTAHPPPHSGVTQSQGPAESEPAAHCDDDRKMYLQAALVRIMKQRKVLRHTELIQEVVSQARGSFAPSVHMIKKCIEALIDKQYLERTPAALDTYSYLA